MNNPNESTRTSHWHTRTRALFILLGLGVLIISGILYATMLGLSGKGLALKSMSSQAACPPGYRIDPFGRCIRTSPPPAPNPAPIPNPLPTPYPASMVVSVNKTAITQGETYTLTATYSGAPFTGPSDFELVTCNLNGTTCAAPALLPSLADGTFTNGLNIRTTNSSTQVGTYKFRIRPAGETSTPWSNELMIKVNAANALMLGHIDTANCTVISGWAFDPSTPSTTIRIKVYEGSTLRGEINTNDLRADVNAAYSITGTHGFALTLPDRIKDSMPHVLQTRAQYASSANEAVIDTKTLTCPGSPTTFTSAGWDPGLTKRYIATTNPTEQTYFESCPDIASGCYPQRKTQDGFYTLSPEIGGVNVPCKVNSAANFSVNGQLQPCPFKFSWEQGTDGRPAGHITSDTSSWTTSITPNIWLGFQENAPYGTVYAGGKNLPSISKAYVSASVTPLITNVAVNQNARVRFVSGISWYVPTLNKSFVLEMNMGGVNTQAEPAWSLTAEAVSNAACGEAVQCLYLGGQFWNTPAIASGSTTQFAIDWEQIAKRLVQDGLLPSQAVGDYPLNGVYTGPEMLGRGKVDFTIQNVKISSVENVR